MPHLDVLWNGSENRGLSIAILEAMAAGVPVIASDTPCNRELVVEGETGYLIPLGSRAGRAARARWTDRIFTDAALAASACRGVASRVWRKRFSAERMTSEYEQLYRVCDPKRLLIRRQPAYDISAPVEAEPAIRHWPASVKQCGSGIAGPPDAEVCSAKRCSAFIELYGVPQPLRKQNVIGRVHDAVMVEVAVMGGGAISRGKRLGR